MCCLMRSVRLRQEDTAPPKAIRAWRFCGIVAKSWQTPQESKPESPKCLGLLCQHCDGLQRPGVRGTKVLRRHFRIVLVEAEIYRFFQEVLL